MYNLNTVIKFEVIRTLKKKSFWIMALAFPIVIAAIFAMIFFSNQATDQAAKDAETQKFSLAVTDESHLVNPALLARFNAHTPADKAGGISDVRAGKVDAYFYYPDDISKGSVEVYGRDVGLFDNGRYTGVAKFLLNESAASHISDSQRAILQDTVQYNAITYRDGEAYDGFKQLIAPGLFLVLFYALIAMFGSQMLTSTTEEKENRVIEMLLTTIDSRTLIIGKILSLVIVGMIQMLIILIPIVTLYALFHDSLSLPNIDLSSLPLDATRIGLGFAIFATSFLLFTGLLVAIGSATPTAKEAGGFFGVVMMLIFGPLYAAPLFVSSPDSPWVQFLSYFPFTAPIPLLLRNAVGNLEIWQALIAIGILAITAAVVLSTAVRLFRYGALEYSRRLSWRDIL